MPIEYELPYSVKKVVSDQLRLGVQEGRLIPKDKAEDGVALRYSRSQEVMALTAFVQTTNVH